jgi:uncharacterized protein (AIM24 family)
VQSIYTRYFGPTNTRGSRIRAAAAGGARGTVTVPYDHGLDSDGNHDVAAKKLAHKLGWHGKMHRGSSPDGRGYVYVFEGGGSIQADPRRRRAARTSRRSSRRWGRR